MHSIKLNRARGRDGAVIVIMDDKALDDPNSSAMYERDARKLFDLLRDQLPGGIYDKLCDMLQLNWKINAEAFNEYWKCNVCGYMSHRSISMDHNCPMCLGTCSLHRDPVEKGIAEYRGGK